jgi:hypothetical protein
MVLLPSEHDQINRQEYFTQTQRLKTIKPILRFQAFLCAFAALREIEL